jgi:Do/DeqQ family serine protease
MTSPTTPDTPGGPTGKPAGWKKSAAFTTAVSFGTAVLLLLTTAWHGGFAERTSAAGVDQAAVHAQQAPAIGHALAGGRDSYADIVKTVAPAVITVQADGRATPQATAMPQMPDSQFFRRFFGPDFDERQIPRQRGREHAIGSGVIVSQDGYVQTNNHILHNATAIKVNLTDGRTQPAKLVGADKPSDLALLKVEATGLSPISLGNSEGVQVGDVVLAVGNPLNLGQTVTMGIISAKGRSTSAGSGSYEDFLQTDAPINHGNSGGALVDMKGQLIGITSQILSPSDGNIGIGFAIPVNMARNVMDQLKTGGKVHRSQLGVMVQPLTSDLAESMNLKQTGGAIVGSVEPGSAAEKAGLKRGDVILSFNGSPVRDTNTLRNRVAESKPGSNAAVVISRDGREQTMNVTLAEASEARGPRGRAAEGDDDSTDDNSGATGNATLGISVTPVTPEMARNGRANRGGEDAITASGLLVEQVDPDGRAADAGIQPGDVIQEVNRQQVRSVDQLKTAVQTKSDKPLLFLISRGGRDLFLTIRPNS